ncbi:hypothetical protein KVR01_009162 [Diaporthe batatas]|uniref:uncharacterized protein n=1 Tax=Diaporthe batatas TaxID=748121 RepID=UPI001D03EB46|nr:uncharacterized protein KVR01_009162 [Diaporthe batatas]KAG8160898.1 hypothetical protein KVR01_009162 [Diaporthe batatas]
MAELDLPQSTFSAWMKVVATILLLYYCISNLYSWRRLRHVPGPFMAGVTSLWEMSVTATGQEPWVYNKLAKKHGHLVRISPNTILTDDPEVLRKISGVRKSYVKDAFYSATLKHPDHDTMFSTIDTPLHDEMKARLAGAYGGRETLAMEPIVDDLIEALIQHIRDETSLGLGRKGIIDFAITTNSFTMDVITRVSFGKELGFLRTHSDVYGLMAAVRDSMRTYTIPMAIPWLRSITTSRFFLRQFGPKKTDKVGPGVVIGALEETIQKRCDQGALEDKDLLGAFIRSGLSPGECMSEALFSMVAGSDTTAAAIRATMLYLITTPRVYQKMKQVVEEAVHSGRVSNPIKQAEAKEIPYLQVGSPKPTPSRGCGRTASS